MVGFPAALHTDMTRCSPDVCTSVTCVGSTDSLHTDAASTGGPVDGVLLVPVFSDNARAASGYRGSHCD